MYGEVVTAQTQELHVGAGKQPPAQTVRPGAAHLHPCTCLHATAVCSYIDMGCLYTAPVGSSSTYT